MATNWNNTKGKSVVSFLAFFLGVTLTVGSLGGALGRIVLRTDRDEWWKNDWQESQAFRDQVAGYLEDFLTLGAGGVLDWYDTAWKYGGMGAAYEERVLLSSPDRGIFTEEAMVYPTEVPAEDAAYPDEQLKAHPDLYYQNDKNVLYRIYVDGRIRYENTDAPVGSLGDYMKLPEGYNFLLYFRGGRVSANKGGENIDIYGDGIYDQDSQWFVPGYENFPAGEGVEHVAVYMAVRETPAQYLAGDYENGGVEQSCRMYWLYQDIQKSWMFYRDQFVFFAAGLALLAVWLHRRKDRPQADRKIASWTIHVWTEARFLAVGFWLVYLLFGSGDRRFYVYNVYHMLPNAVQSGPDGIATALSYGIGIPLSNIPALLGLGWTFWLIGNDHRYNPKEERRSIRHLVSVRAAKYPFQKRVSRRNRLAVVLALISIIPALLLADSLGLSPFYWPLWLLVGVPIAATILILLILRKNAALAKDIGLLADQVEAIRGGDLETPLTLPRDADLRQAAEHLNDIQAGLHTAVAEQTRSERMKVELISNVSHDLKTPLTSILSYAELLRQEELPPAAADYARVIDEKAQRLKVMVQDVFEVSKAAADQLPVKPERLDLAKLLRQTLADMEDPIQQSALAFKTDLPEEPVFITADGQRLYRVFQNLIQNALQYALEGSRVYLTLKTDGNTAAASLRNTSRNELPEGMDFTARFVRGDESRTDGGSGLGLSIAESFTEACGGTFRVETVADLFTAVVEFPLAE